MALILPVRYLLAYMKNLLSNLGFSTVMILEQGCSTPGLQAKPSPHCLKPMGLKIWQQVKSGITPLWWLNPRVEAWEGATPGLQAQSRCIKVGEGGARALGPSLGRRGKHQAHFCAELGGGGAGLQALILALRAPSTLWTSSEPLIWPVGQQVEHYYSRHLYLLHYFECENLECSYFTKNHALKENYLLMNSLSPL